MKHSDIKISCFCMEDSEIDNLSACHRFILSEKMVWKVYRKIFIKKDTIHIILALI